MTYTPVHAQPNVAEASACHACGLVQALPSISRKAAALLCARCGGTLRQVRQHSIALCAACAVLGLVLFGIALYQPVASVLMQGGRFATTDILTAPEHLRQAGSWLLAWAVVPTLVLLPFAKLVTVAAMALSLRLGHAPGLVRRAFAELPRLSQWAMLEVFCSAR